MGFLDEGSGVFSLSVVTIVDFIISKNWKELKEVKVSSAGHVKCTSSVRKVNRPCSSIIDLGYVPLFVFTCGKERDHQLLFGYFKDMMWLQEYIFLSLLIVKC